jgi:rhodanese-related sulfurtransferase
MRNTVFESTEDNLHYQGVKDISPQELNKNLNKVCLIDVRQPEEFTGELGHIPGAQLIVLDTLNENREKIPKEKPVVFVCRSGGRSAKASAWALEQGFQQVYNLKGGMLLWNELHLETKV